MTERCSPARSPRNVLSVLSVLSALSGPLPAQTVRAHGYVLRVDSTPVPGARVVLHQVGRETQGPIDSTRSDKRGRFRLTFRPDTTAFYLLSARYAGIEYFSPPVPTNPERPDSSIRIAVYDTSSTAPITLEARHLVLTRPGQDGSRSILDLIILRNEGRVTRVAPDTVRPSWSALLPPGTLGLQVSEGDVSLDAVSRRGDTLIVTAAIAPGEKQLTLQYQVPADRRAVELTLDQPGLAINVLTEESSVRVVGPGISLADSQVIQGRSFRRWTGVVPVAGVVRLLLPDVGATPRWVLAALVAGLAFALGGAGWYVLTRRGGKMAQLLPDELLDAIAALDARYLGREGETPAPEWSSYQSKRARLKAELEASLAAGGWSQ
jgi:hypothetical protein